MLKTILMSSIFLASVGANALTWNCKPKATQEGFSNTFLNATVSMGNEMTFDLNIAELDVYKSCGAQNIGKFSTVKAPGTTVTENAKTGAVTITKHYAGLTGEVEETASIEEVSSKKGKHFVKVNWSGSCVEYAVRDVLLVCSVR